MKDFNIHYLGEFNPTNSKNATIALQFYEDHADALDNPIYFEKLEALGNEKIDMNMLRAYCKVGKRYSHSRFMTFCAEWFKTTVPEMKNQWRNIKTKTTTYG